MKAQSIFLAMAATGLVAAFAVATSFSDSSAKPAKTLIAADAGTPHFVASAQPAAPAQPAKKASAKLFEPTHEQREAAKSAYGKLPLSFEPNHGQTHKQFQFTANGTGFNFYLKPTEAVIMLRSPKAKPGEAKPTDKAALSMKLMGANQDGKLAGDEAKIGRSNYFIGNDIALTDIPNYGKVRSEKVYPGIDLVYYGNQNQLEYDFIVAPNADPSAIKFSLSGQDKAEIDAIGNLVLETIGGKIVQHKPFIYQHDKAGESHIVKGAYNLENCKNGSVQVSFKVEDYDKSLPLVIDPVLVYSTFFGDTPHSPPTTTSDHSGDEGGNGIAIDAQGNAYVVGFTNSYEFPTVGPIEIIDDPVTHDTDHAHYHYNPEKYFAFISKFDPKGASLLFSTKFGSGNVQPYLNAIPTNDDIATAVAVDPDGNIFVTGTTRNSNFPVKNALHIYSSGIDTFLLKLTTTGNNLLFSTYIGGQNDDTPTDIAYDPTGFIYVVGVTNSIDLPVSHAFQSQNGGGKDAFVAKFKDDGSEQTYCTYLGGAADDGANGVAVDSSGNVYITGFTNSTNFPTASPIQVANNGGSDAFVSKINANGSLLVYSTYLGGSGSDVGNGIAVDSAGNAYIVGTTKSQDFPTISQTVLPVQTALNGTSDAFVTKIDKFGSSLVYSTYFGGEGDETGVKIRVDNRSAVYVIGTTSSVTSAFPISPGFNTLQPAALHNQTLTNPVQPNPINTGQKTFAYPLATPPVAIDLVITVPARPQVFEGFLAKFNPTGTPLVYSTYLGADKHTFQFEAFDSYYHSIAVGSSTLTLNHPAVINDERNTIVLLAGLAVDDSGNAYITGSTEGSFLYTFGAYSTIPGRFAVPGQDFPALHIKSTPISTGSHAGELEDFPAEASTSIFHDDRDVIICKIGDSSPLITSSQTLLGTKNLALAYSIIATNNPTSYNAAGLPPGLFVNTADGQISGIPTQSGSFKVVLTATNASGTGALILFLTVSQLPPVITSSLSTFANVDTIFRYQITADNDPGTFAAVGLPLGLTLDANTGLISGTPLVASTNSVKITATNASGSDTQTLVINVLPPLPVITSATISQGVYNFNYTSGNPLYTITATNNPSQYNASGLPPGLTVDTSTGKIFGTATSLGFFNVTISATNGGGTTNSLWKLTIIPALVPGITSAGIATGTVNEPFTYTISAIQSPLAFGVVPSLPPGLTLNDVTGVISGIPTAPGVFTVTLQAVNSAGTGTKTLVITIVNPAAPVITSPLTATAIANTPFEYDIQAANHPIAFNAGGLPAGLSVNTGTGVITGSTAAVTPPNTPTNITISAANAGGTGGATLALTVIAQQIPVILSAGTATGYVNIPFTYQTIANGLPTSYNAAGLPPGLTINTSTGLISGTPTTTVGSPFSVTLSAKNAAGTGTKTVVFTISVPTAPSFTNTNTALGNDGATFSFTISATGSAPIVFTAAPLPVGLSQINNTTIFGKPSGGITQVILTAYNPATNPTTPNGPANPGGVAPVTMTLTLNIASAPATIANTILTATAVVGTPFNFPIQTSGTAPITVSTSLIDAPATIQLPLSAAVLPSGLTLTGNSTVGYAISGTPTPASVTLNGPLSITLLAANSVGGNSKTLLLTVKQAPPVITSGLYVTGTDGSPFRYTISATGTQIITYKADNLPPGLAFDGNVISGTPTSGAIGITKVTLTATNLGGQDIKTLVVQVNPAPPVITSALTATASVGIPFAYTVTATGSPDIVFGIPNLPAGLTFTTDKIGGAPTTVGTFGLVLNATNVAGSDTQTLILTVLPSPPVIAAAVLTGFDGTPFSFTPTVTGSTPITFTATSLPTGFSIDPNTGTITGTPTQPGTFLPVITATNSGGSASKTFTITVVPSAPTITSSLSVQGTPGTPFTYTITATGTPTITFQSGNLPPGLTQSGNVISGTPTTIAKTPVTLIATNSVGKDTKILVIDIAQTPPTLTNALTVNGQDGQPFSFFLTSKGSPVITFSASPLPAGLALNTATGEISGTPTVVGQTSVKIGATNPFGSDTGKVLSISISATPARITSPLAANGSLGEAFSYTITATGTMPITFDASALPPGLSVDKNTGVISGSPLVPGTTISSITAKNTAGSDTKQLVITSVANPPVITSPLAASASLTTLFNYTITATGQPVISFSVTGLPPGLSFSNNTISGLATALGTYQVTITATNPSGTDVKILILTVSDDLDGDGFPDDLEAFLGTDPNNPNVNGFVNGKGTIGVLNITSMSVKLNFAKPGQDSINVKGTLPLASGFTPAGKQAVIYVSGIAAKITLTSNGKGNAGGNSFSIKPGSNSDPIFQFAISKADLKAKLAKVGMTNEDVTLPRTVTTLTLVLLNNTLYRSDKVLNYTARQGKSGSAK